MKNAHEDNILIVAAAVLAYVILALTAICSIIMTGGVIGVAWGTLAGLVLLGGIAVALVVYFFRRIELIDQKVYI